MQLLKYIAAFLLLFIAFRISLNPSRMVIYCWNSILLYFQLAERPLRNCFMYCNVISSLCSKLSLREVAGTKIMKRFANWDTSFIFNLLHLNLVLKRHWRVVTSILFLHVFLLSNSCDFQNSFILKTLLTRIMFVFAAMCKEFVLAALLWQRFVVVAANDT